MVNKARLVPPDLPQQQDVLKRKLPLEPDEQPAEAEAERAAVLRVWRTQTRRLASEASTPPTSATNADVRPPTQEVAQFWVQSPQQDAELQQLLLHGLLRLFKVLVLHRRNSYHGDHIFISTQKS